jgi:hypothetical protein
MIFKMRNIVSCIIILLNVLNLFISFHHFAHHDHTINPQTGEIEHAHNCGHDHDENEETEDNSYLPSGSAHHYGEHDKCETLDSVLKQVLKNKVFSVVLFGDLELPHIKTAFYSSKASSDILSFAPKNSPPVS